MSTMPTNRLAKQQNSPVQESLPNIPETRKGPSKGGTTIVKRIVECVQIMSQVCPINKYHCYMRVVNSRE